MRDRMEQAAAEQNQRLAAIVMASDDAIISQAADGTILSWNPGAERMYGHAAADIIGRSAASLIPADRAGEEQEILQRVFAGEEVDHYETTRIRADGRQIDISLTVSPIRAADGQIRSAASIARDITMRRRAQEELERSEERFRGMIENANDIITLLDAQGRLLYTSPGVRRFGYEPEQLVGEHYLAYLHRDDMESVSDAFADVLRSPDRTVTIECRVRRSDGSWRSVEAIARNALHNPAIHAIVVNARDVTYRQQLEQRLRQAHKMEAIGRLAGGIAHDFNNMLMVLKGHLDLLRENVPAGLDVTADLDEIGRACDRVAGLTQQLLAVSRRQVLQPQVMDVNALVHELEPTIRRLLGRNIELVSLLTPGLWATRADRSQLEQVIINLVMNAHDAMPDGGVVTVRTANVERSSASGDALPAALPAGSYVLLSVADTGAGVDEATRAQLFDPFFTTKGRGRGRGLGLSTVHGIVQQSGGHISVESGPGEGATFCIFLPRAVDAELPAASAPAAAQIAAGTTVLLIEDEPAVRSLVRRALQQAGYTVLEAASSDQALRVAADPNAPIDIIVSDVIMPMVRGPDLVARLRQQRPDLPVVFMSGYIDEVPLHADTLTEGTYFIAKPFTPRLLVDRVREALDAATRSRQ